MLYSTFTTYLEKLESTSSRLTLIEILSELFTEADEEDVDKIVYLLQGRIAPFFAPVEIGMADKNVASALALAYGVDRDEVLKLNGELGDMGLAALQLSQKSKVKSQKLSVEDIFDVLTQIAGTSGEGSVEKKQVMLVELLQKLDSVSVKHLVRVPLGRTRLGIGDPTVLDALATAKLGDKTKRKVLEGAYNRTSDLGLIARELWSGGLSAVEALKVRVGFPIRSELCERLPTPDKVIEKMGEVDVQYKYDGFRVQIHKNGNEVRMFSRNLEDMSNMFPELKEATLKQVKAKSIILDTEALAYNPASEEFLPFQETTKRRRKHGIEEMAEKLPLKSFVFDILFMDGKSLIDKPLSERMEILKEVIKEDDVLIRTKNQTITDPKELALLLEDAISKGLEGLVVKKLESPYVAGGRNFNWVKLKRHSSGDLHDTIDCVILGYIFGRGKRAAFGAGALLVGVYDEKRDEFVTVSKIGTGLTDEEWISIKEKTKGAELSHKPARVDSLITPSVWVKPEIVIEVLADEITRSPMHTAGLDKENGEAGYALRFPRLVSFRDKDKKAEDATTVKELTAMYEQQGKKE
jgi:DNA ligase-1